MHMKSKAHGILSFVLLLLPVLWWGAPKIGDRLSEEHEKAAWILTDFIGLQVLGESFILLYIIYPVLCAVVEVILYRVSDTSLPKKLKHVLLAFPLALGICGIVFFLLFLSGKAWLALPFMYAMEVLWGGWLVSNIAALIYLRREKRQDNV